MDLCLHDTKQGYYATQPGLGTDFITAPEISQVFGELIGLWAAYEWRAMGAPAVFNLVEYGPGRGTLMSDALRSTGGVDGFHAALQLTLIEPSPALRAVQAKTLYPYSPTFAYALPPASAGVTLILANEYLDCLPARQFVKAGETWHERVIGVSEEGELCFGLAADRTPEAELLDDHSSAEIQPALDVLVDELKKRAEAGEQFRALFIDYGTIGGAPTDTLRAFKDGKQIDPLAAPGESDLTVDVDFGRLKTLCEAAGLKVCGPISQSHFLQSLGIETRMRALVKSSPEKANTIFQSVSKLVDPSEMGQRFNVLCISSPDLVGATGF